MKLILISAVAGFLLYTVMAERNGPTKILNNSRRLNETSIESIQARRSNTEGRMINVRNENPVSGRRRPTTFKIMSFSRSPRTSQRKNPGTTTTGNPFIATGRYLRSQRSLVRSRRRYFASKSRETSRSFDLGMESNHLPVQELTHGAIFLEPVYHGVPKKSFLSHLFGAHFTPESNDMPGPLLGPLDFPGMGKNVYIRLTVQPDEETASHITVHLVNRGPIESEFSDIHENTDFEHPGNEKPEFSDEKSTPFAVIQPQKLQAASSPPNSGESRFVDKSVDHSIDLTPPKLDQSFEFLSVQNNGKIHEQMMNNQHAVQFDNPLQYLAASNHHQLPVVLRPAENLVNLPVYPPLPAGKSKGEIESGDNEDEASAESQMFTDVFDDRQQSSSYKHTLVYPNYVISPTARQSIRFLASPRPEVRTNRRESPTPVFMEEIRAPDLSSYNISMTNEPATLGKTRNATVPKNGTDDHFVNLKLESSSTSPASHEDKYVAPVTSDYPSKHTTTSTTKYTIF